MKKILVVLLSMLFIGCAVERKAGIHLGERLFTCVDLDKGLYKGDDGKLYRISYSVNGSELKFYLIEE